MIYLDGIVFSLQKFGGISNYFYNLNKELLRFNQNVKMITYNDKKSDYIFSNPIHLQMKLYIRVILEPHVQKKI